MSFADVGGSIGKGEADLTGFIPDAVERLFFFDSFLGAGNECSWGKTVALASPCADIAEVYTWLRGYGVHDIQANVPPENIVAMWEAWKAYGVY